MRRLAGVPLNAYRALSGESGFSLIEMVLATVIFLVVATGLAGVLTSSIAAHKVARERTLAQQAAMDWSEYIRRLDYDDVGVVSSNPPGVILSSKGVDLNGSGSNEATLTTQVSYVDDPTPSSYATAANYKRVVITVTRNDNGKQLAREVTYVSSLARQPLGGINNAIINATVTDYALATPVQGVTVNLANGPSPNRSDVTDSSGLVSFPALDPNPTSGANAYYDLTASLTGYQQLREDTPPGSAVPPAGPGHIQLAPSQTYPTAIHVYKPASLTITVNTAAGTAYASALTLVVGSPRGAQTIATWPNGSARTITTLDGGTLFPTEPIVPSVSYRVAARTNSGNLYASALVQAAAPNYASGDTSTNVVLTLSATPILPVATKTLTVNVKNSSGVNVIGARVDVNGGDPGPNGSYYTLYTNSSGNAVFTVPAPSSFNYTVKAWGPSGTVAPGAIVTMGSTNKTQNVVVS